MQSYVGHLNDYGLDPTHKEALQRNVKPRNCLIGIVFGKNHCLQWGKQIRGEKWKSPQYAAHSAIMFIQLQMFRL